MRIPPSETGMSIHAVMTAARRQEGKRRPAIRTRTPTAARTQCQRATALIPPIPRPQVLQQLISSAKVTAAITSTDQRNASTHGSQSVHERPATPGWSWGVTFTKTSVLLPARLGHTGRRWPDYGRTAALNIAYRCIAVNSVPPGQQAYEPVADVALSHLRTVVNCLGLESITAATAPGLAQLSG